MKSVKSERETDQGRHKIGDFCERREVSRYLFELIDIIKGCDEKKIDFVKKHIALVSALKL